LKKTSLALSTSTRTLSLSIAGTSMDAALATSTQEKLPAAAASVRPAENFKASRRLNVVISGLQGGHFSRVQICEYAIAGIDDRGLSGD
jgi:hypothetical protein